METYIVRVVAAATGGGDRIRVAIGLSPAR